VLGLSYEQLGVGVAKVWGLPESLRRAMTRPEGQPPARAVVNEGDRMRWCVAAAGELAQTLLQESAETLPGKLVRIGERFSRAVDVPRERFDIAVRKAQTDLKSMSAGLGLDLRADSKARRLLAQPLATPTDARAPAAGPAAPPSQRAAATAAASAASAAASSASAASAAASSAPAVTSASAPATGYEPTLALPPGGLEVEALAGLLPAPVVPSSPATDDAARALALEQGIASVTHALAGDSFRLNEVLRAILEAMHVALGFRCVVFALRDPKSGVITGRFGLGAPATA